MIYQIYLIKMTLKLKQQMQKANNLDEAIKLNLQKIGYTI